MKLVDLRNGIMTDLILATHPVDAAALEPGSEVSLGREWTSYRGLVQVADKVLSAKVRDAHQRGHLDRILQQNLPRLAWLVAARATGSEEAELCVRVHEFGAIAHWEGPLDLGITESIIEDVRARILDPRTSTERVVEWLNEQCFVSCSVAEGERCAFLAIGSARFEGRLPAFRLLGFGAAVDVRQDSQGRLTVERVTTARQALTDEKRRGVRIVRGLFRFCDVTVAGLLRDQVQGQIGALVERTESFLRRWDLYSILERRLAVKRQRECGVVRYRSCEPGPDGSWRFHLDIEAETTADRLRKMVQEAGADGIEAAEQAPDVVSRPMTDEEFDAVITEESRTAPQRGPAAFVGRVQRLDPGNGFLDLRLSTQGDEAPPRRGALFLSDRGHEVSWRRRRRALEAVRTGNTQLPQLGLLLEGERVPTARPRRREPLSPAARAAFGGEPTPQQRRALDIALNTPDIALIQGPPGTGKTRLIAALQIRLAEIAKEQNDGGATVLVTSVQHDAVENAAEAAQVFGLPTVKVGRRRELAHRADPVELWRSARADTLRQRLRRTSARPATSVLREVLTRQHAYMEAPGPPRTAIRLLRWLAEIAGPFISVELRGNLLGRVDQLERLAQQAALAADGRRPEALRVVRALRTTAAAYEDDGLVGVLRAKDALGALNILADTDREVLDSLGRTDGTSGHVPDLTALSALKERLLDKLTGAGIAAHQHFCDAETQRLLAATVESLEGAVANQPEGVEVALEDFLLTLETDLDGVRTAVHRYASVLAATCQQASSRTMVELMRTTNDGQAAGFESVLVDEAARANPLDLLIPMVLGRRRIILVGDHRQLPHVLEPEIERLVDQRTEAATRTVLRQSLFERLFREVLPELAKHDRQHRVITLDTQYRMHEALGGFVSRAFYELHGEPRLRSDRPESDFHHDLAPYQGKVAVWVDVPATQPTESERAGMSKSRPAEAEVVARQLAELLAQPGAQGLTFGVITFYSAQEVSLWVALARQGIAERLDDGSYQVLERWGDARHGRDRIRVATVDAIQGKEFDVVLLSMVRSNTMTGESPAQLRRKYGHLMLPNRLCVAMSRQKRLLIVCGDAAMLDHPAAGTELAGLVEFRKLCGTEHGCYR